MIYIFLLTAHFERHCQFHFRFCANWLMSFNFLNATVGEETSQVNQPRTSHQLHPPCTAYL